jgi:anti-anti-sigma factor
MTSAAMASTPVERADTCGPAPSTTPIDCDPASAPSAVLEVDRLGLLAGRTGSLSPDRRVAEWIASNLDLDCQTPAARRSAWDRLIGNLPSLRRPAKPTRAAQAAEASSDSWARFRVAYKRGITLVRLVDKALVKEARVRELARDLLDLIAAGNQRVVLNFQQTERVASWVVIAVDEARRRCAAGDGGALKICGLPQALASIFPLAGVTTGIDFYPDEAAALESEWPPASGPRPLPIDVLSALTKAADIPPIRGGSPSETGIRRHARGMAEPVRDHSVTRESAPSATDLRLRIQVGGANSREVAVSGPRFMIGRAAHCQLRLGSAMVSKVHAVIERRQFGIMLRDFGSTNGTIVNGRSIRGEEVEIKDGDRIQIGPVVATVMLGPGRAPGGKVEELVAGWLQGERTVQRPYHGESAQTISYPAFENPVGDAELRVNCEVIQEVVVITPQVSELDDDNAIEQLRAHFHALYEQPLPRRVVVNFEYIRHLSGHAIGVLLAHHLRLDRAGGALRICQVHARVMAVLHQVNLTMLVECHPTLDEAVLGAWPDDQKQPQPGD